MPGQGGVPLVESRAPAEGVYGSAPAHGEQPPGGITRHAISRPGHQRLGQRLLGQVLGQCEIAGEPGERADDARGLDSPHRGDGLTAAVRTAYSWPVATRHARSFRIHSLSCGNSSILVTRRISVLTPGPLIGARLAHSTASSFEATSRIQKPPNNSLVSP